MMSAASIHSRSELSGSRVGQGVEPDAPSRNLMSLTRLAAAVQSSTVICLIQADH
jgi:hypothetical protein